MRRHVQGLRGTVRPGGRIAKPRRSHECQADLSTLLALTVQWQRFHGDVWTKHVVGDYPGEIQGASGTKAETLRDLLSQAAGTLRGLAAAARQAASDAARLRRLVRV
jgi:hypothetical protein